MRFGDPQHLRTWRGPNQQNRRPSYSAKNLDLDGGAAEVVDHGARLQRTGGATGRDYLFGLLEIAVRFVCVSLLAPTGSCGSVLLVG